MEGGREGERERRRKTKGGGTEAANGEKGADGSVCLKTDFLKLHPCTFLQVLTVHKLLALCSN